LLTSDGSLSTLQCLAAAKRATLVRIVDATTGSDAQREAAATLVMYTSEHVPDHLPAVAHLLGLAGERVRVIPMRDQRLDLEALRSVIASDRESGLRPFCVCASAGSQATGAIDPLRELAALCATESLWLHVDGSLGGLAVLDESLPELAALAQADSVVVEPQRWLGVPVECAVALVRDATWLDRSDAYAQLQRSSGFRALKLWSTLLHLGRDGVRSRVELHRALARALAVHVEHEPKLELMLKPELGIVCFRYVGIHEATEAKLNAFNRGLVAQLQAEGEVYPTGVELNGRYGLHVSVMHHATRATDLSFLVQIVLKAGARLQEATLR
jgi:glutamate/tyrosine decarboxylase-like PLP-dependent enzyme